MLAALAAAVARGGVGIVQRVLGLGSVAAGLRRAGRISWTTAITVALVGRAPAWLDGGSEVAHAPHDRLDGRHDVSH